MTWRANLGANLEYRPAALVGVLAAANLACLLLTWYASRSYGQLLAAGLLAYGFGLRHAVDVDHICAIDNTTRKLLGEGKRPIGVGFFFSLGHSTVVVLLCGALAVSTAFVERHLSMLRNAGSLVGTAASGFFLYAIAFINLLIVVDLWKALKRKQRGDAVDEAGMARSLDQRSLVGRLCAPLMGLVDSSWKMYFVGFVFGLGFDTATEVGVLALSARSGQVGIPLWAIMLLPALFTAGMCLVDTIDGILMLRAYGWSMLHPVRKLYYNLSLTFISVAVAFLVGTSELAQAVHQRLAPEARHSSARLELDGMPLRAVVALRAKP